jgi:hypothetical protein
MEMRAYGDPGSHANHEALEAYRHSSFPENEGAPEPAYRNAKTNLFDQPTIYGQVAQAGCATDDLVSVPDTIATAAPQPAAQLKGRHVGLWQNSERDGRGQLGRCDCRVRGMAARGERSAGMSSRSPACSERGPHDLLPALRLQHRR